MVLLDKFSSFFERSQQLVISPITEFRNSVISSHAIVWFVSCFQQVLGFGHCQCSPIFLKTSRDASLWFLSKTKIAGWSCFFVFSLFFCTRKSAPPKTNMSPENQWLEVVFPIFSYWNGPPFRGHSLVFRGVSTNDGKSQLCWKTRTGLNTLVTQKSHHGEVRWRSWCCRGIVPVQWRSIAGTGSWCNMILSDDFETPWISRDTHFHVVTR